MKVKEAAQKTGIVTLGAIGFTIGLGSVSNASDLTELFSGVAIAGISAGLAGVLCLANSDNTAPQQSHDLG